MVTVSPKLFLYDFYPEEHVYNAYESNESHEKHCFKKQTHSDETKEVKTSIRNSNVYEIN